MEAEVLSDEDLVRMEQSLNELREMHRVVHSPLSAAILKAGLKAFETAKQEREDQQNKAAIDRE